MNARRQFLRYLAGSPLLALPRAEPIQDPADALNVFDFHDAAKAILPKAHYGYLATGVDDDRTLHANSDAFQRYQLRMRRLVDVRNVDTGVELLGRRWETPIVLCPVGSQRAFHADGEIAVAKAARASKHLQILSTTTTSSVEDVAEARGEPIWYQLYPTEDWTITRSLLKRAEGAGCPVVALTVDLYGGSNRETLARFQVLDDRDCDLCHERDGGYRGYIRNKPMFQGLDISGAESNSPSDSLVGFRGSPQGRDDDEALPQGHRHRRGRGVSTRARCRWPRGLESWRPRRRERAVDDSSAFPKWRGRSRAAFPCSSMAGSGGERTSSKRSPWARMRSESDAPTSGGSPRSGKRASKRCLEFSAASSKW